MVGSTSADLSGPLTSAILLILALMEDGITARWKRRVTLDQIRVEEEVRPAIYP